MQCTVFLSPGKFLHVGRQQPPHRRGAFSNHRDAVAVAVVHLDNAGRCRVWTLREIAEGVGGGIFTPNFEGEIRRVAELPDVGR